MRSISGSLSMHVKFATAAIGLACTVLPGTSNANQWYDMWTNLHASTYQRADGNWIMQINGVDIPTTEMRDCYDMPYPPTIPPNSPTYCRGAPIAGSSQTVYRLYKAVTGNAQVIFYESENFGGTWSLPLTVSSPHFSNNDLSSAAYGPPSQRTVYSMPSWDNRIRSLKIPYGMTLNLYENANFGGNMVQLREDQQSLASRNFSGVASSYAISQPGN